MKKIIFTVVFVVICTMSFSQNANFIITGSSLKIINSGGVKLLLDNTNFENNASDSSIQGQSEFIITGINSTTMGGSFSNNFQNLQINKSGSAVMLSHHLNVSNLLTLTSGNIDIGSNDLNLGTANLVGGSDNSYVKTSGTGVLKRHLITGDQTFPVGNATYNPAILTNNSSTSSDTFNVRVTDNVTLDGTGLGITLQHPFVNRSWSVGATKLDENNNVTLRLHWEEEHEINGFNKANSFMVRHDGKNWEKLGGVLASTFDNNSHTVTDINHFSTFSISSHPLFISNVLHRINKIYPNPVISNLTIEIASKLEENANLKIYTINGSFIVENIIQLRIGLNTIQMNNLSHLQEGIYIICVETNQQVYSKRFIKIPS